MTTKNVKSNVIQFKSAKKNQRNADPIAKVKTQLYGKTSALTSAPSEKVIDLSVRRKEKEASDRRSVTRTVLSQFLGVFLVLPNKGLQPVVLYDVSEAGLSFDLPAEMGAFKPSENVTMRIYLSHDTYFSFHAKIANRREPANEGVVRHGAVFRKDDDSFKTLFYFTKFLENVSQVARKDSGDRLLGRMD